MSRLDRLLVGHFVEPGGVGWVSHAGPTDRYQDNPKTSAGRVGSDPAGHPPTTLTQPTGQINGPLNPRCRIEDALRPALVRRFGDTGPDAWGALATRYRVE